MRPRDTVRPRREFLRSLSATGLAAALGAGAATNAAAAEEGSATTAAEADVTVTVDNVGASAWEVTAVDGEPAPAPVGEQNPILELRVGTRYEFRNDGWRAHPLAFRAVEGDSITVLLSQAGSGTFEDEAGVDWVDDGTSLSFTVTEALAAELNNYRCTVHAAMQGSVETVRPAAFRVRDPSAPASVDVGDPFDVSATVENAGAARATGTVELRVDGTTADSRSVDLGPGATETVRFTGVTVETEGTATLTVATGDDTATTEVTVGSGDEAPIPEKYYTDAGRVTTDRLRTAVSDWARGRIDTPTLQTIVGFWSSGEDVTTGS